MNSKRSYLDTLNAGRQRKPHTTLEQLNRSLENLEQRLDRSREEADQYREPPRFAAEPPLARRPDEDGQPKPQPRALPQRESTFGAPYQAIARDIDRVRGQEEGIAAFGKIAGELKGLREELREQMTSGLQREFDTLRHDIERAYASGAAATGVNEIGHEFERLSAAINALAEKSDDKSVNMLRLELEQVRSAVDTLAREETVLSGARRWDDFDRRWSDFEDRVEARQHVADPAIVALTGRLEQISTAVHNLPESLSLRSLEEKVRTLAGAVDHFARQQSMRGSDTFALVEERLDEISRAIVASAAAAQVPNFDPEPFERIEARISALAHQIEEVADDRPTVEIIDRISHLAQRVDEIAAQAELPEKAMERLGQQIANIADKIDQAPPVPDADMIFRGIEQRFDVLSNMIERRQGDALEQGNMLFRDFERRLDEVADRIDRRPQEPAFDSAGLMNVIDARFASIADQIERQKPNDVSDEVIRGLEAKLENISDRIDRSAAQFAGIDPDLIRSLEAQVAGLTEHLSRPSALLPEFEDIGPRLADLEKSVAGSRDAVLEAARAAAENAVRSLDGSKSQSAAVSGLAQDMKALEALTRRSDDRNAKTFEAIHDTLLKIVDRLGSLESDDPVSEMPFAAQPETARQPEPVEQRKLAVQQPPSMDIDQSLLFSGGMTDLDRDDDLADPDGPVGRSPAEAAAAAAMAAMGADPVAAPEPGGRVRSMLGGLTRAFSKKKVKEQPQLAGSQLPAPENAAPAVDLDEPLDPKFANRPLEPGSGAPDLNAIMKRVRDERGPPVRHSESDAAKSDFIAAARRAAQAAAAEAETLKRSSDIKGPVRALKIGDLLKTRRKTLLMATTGIMIALAGLQLGKAYLADDTQVSNADDPASLVAALQAEPSAAPGEPEAAPQEMATPADDSAAASAGGADEPMDSAAEAEDAVPASTMDPAGTAIAPEAESTQAAPAAPMAVEATAPMSSETPDVAPAKVPEDSETTASTPPVADGTGSAAAAAEPEAPAFTVPADAGPVALREAAESGDAKALFEVASRYADGRGVKTDMPTAAIWYEKAAELGFAPAQYRTGNFYEKGIGVARDVEKAKTWYQLAANQGNASAMHNLAVLFAMGADGTADNDSAARWFIAAAELGVKDSQFNLGILAAKGVGMQQNLEESYKWFALVAKTGDKDAATKRDEIANSLRPEQLERARAAVELWKPKPLDPQANAVDIPESWEETSTTTAGIDMKKAMQNLQAILNKNGYDAGKPDGVIGGKTKAAIEAFQKANGMPATGEVDEKLVRALVALK